LTHIFLVLEADGLGQGVYRILYISIGGQRAETFKNHWPKATSYDQMLNARLVFHAPSGRGNTGLCDLLIIDRVKVWVLLAAAT